MHRFPATLGSSRLNSTHQRVRKEVDGADFRNIAACTLNSQFGAPTCFLEKNIHKKQKKGTDLDIAVSKAATQVSRIQEWVALGRGEIDAPNVSPRAVEMRHDWEHTRMVRCHRVPLGYREGVLLEEREPKSLWVICSGQQGLPASRFNKNVFSNALPISERHQRGPAFLCISVSSFSETRHPPLPSRYAFTSRLRAFVAFDTRSLWKGEAAVLNNHSAFTDKAQGI